MQFTTTLIASILAVAATAAPGAAAAADVEKRQDVGCLLACLGVSAKLQCVTNAGSINELIGCAAGNTALICRCGTCIPEVQNAITNLGLICPAA